MLETNPNRRAFLKTAMGSALVASVIGSSARGKALEPQPATSRLKIAQGLSDLADETIEFLKQLGIEYVLMPARLSTQVTKRPLVPPTDKGPQTGEILQPWTAAGLAEIKNHLESRGLKAEAIHLGRFNHILLGVDSSEVEIESVKRSIRAAGEAAIPVVEYNFTLLRGSEGYARARGRGGAGLRDFDYDRIRNLPSLINVRRHGRQQMWERLAGFLEAVVPVAEEAGVRLALHPNDPPVPEYRRVAQPVRSLDDLKRVIELVDSPSNGITLDTGVVTEMGEDAVSAIRYFGSRDRINHLHFRNVRVQVPYYRYVEVFHDEGDCDMLGCLKALREANYSRLIIPDHTPQISRDSVGSEKGWALALGYIKGLAAAAVR